MIVKGGIAEEFVARIYALFHAGFDDLGILLGEAVRERKINIPCTPIVGVFFLALAYLERCTVKDGSAKSFLNIRRGNNTYLRIGIHFQIRLAYRDCCTRLTDTHAMIEEGRLVRGTGRKKARHEALDWGDLEVFCETALVHIETGDGWLKTFLEFSLSHEFGKKVIGGGYTADSICIPFLPFSSLLCRSWEVWVRIESPF
jgi:hypothetical protein